MTRGIDGDTLIAHRVVHDWFTSLCMKLDEDCSFSCHHAYGRHKVDMYEMKQQERSFQPEATTKLNKVMDEIG